MRKSRHINIYELAIVTMMFYEVVLKQSTLSQVVNVTALSYLVWGASVVLLGIKTFRIRYTKLQLAGCLLAVAVATIATYRNMGEFGILKFVLFFIAYKGENIEHITYIYKRTYLVFAVNIIALSLLRVIPNPVYYRPNGMARYGLGFTAPSSIGIFLFNIFLLYMKNKYKTTTYKDIVVTTAILGVLWYLVNCKTAIIATVLLLLCFLVLRVYPKVFQSKLIWAAPLICVGGSLYFTLCYDTMNSLHVFLNSLLSIRLSLGNTFYKQVGITWLGQNTRLEELEGVWVDNSYISLLLRFGVVSLVLVLAIYFKAFQKTRKTKQYYLMCAMIVAFFYAVSEMTLYNVTSNIICFFVFDLVLNSRSKDEPTTEERLIPNKLL